MAADGHNLVLVARSQDKLEALKKKIETETEIRVDVMVADLSDPDSPKQVVERLEKKKLHVEILINNAGFGDLAAFAKADWNKLATMIQVNVTALTELTHRLLPPMLKKQSGKIVNVASTAAFQPGPLMAVYYATKAYVLHFSEAIANELESSGVAVTCLCPGPTATGFQKEAEIGDSVALFNQQLPTAAEVAQFGYQALKRGQVVAVHGWRNRLGVFALRFAPRSFVVRTIRRIQE